MLGWRTDACGHRGEEEDGKKSQEANGSAPLGS
jgi:hypothetical protein